MKGSSLINWLINHLPFELHLPGYNYCGPGTKLLKRLKRNERGINKLDEYCKDHDLAYNASSSLSDRHSADIKLMKMARKRIGAANASLQEKMAAHLVNKAMLMKVASGSGNKKTSDITLSKGHGLKKHLKQVISHTKNTLKKLKPKCKKLAIKLAIAAAKEMSSELGIKLPRIIPVPKSGGVLPLIAIFAGLSAAGSLSGGVSGIIKAINECKEAKHRLDEQKRHNEKIEAMSIGKGLNLEPHKDGFRLHLSQKKN